MGIILHWAAVFGWVCKKVFNIANWKEFMANPNGKILIIGTAAL